MLRYGAAVKGLFLCPSGCLDGRSYLVNLTHMDEIGDAFLTINNMPVPISKVVKAELMARRQKM